MPTRRGRNQVAPLSGTMARFTKMELKRASAEAMRMSQASASEKPAPTQTPLTAAMLGLGQAWRKAGAIMWLRVRPARPGKGRSTRSPPRAVRSVPELKPRPAPVISTTRTSSSPLAMAMACSISATVSRLMAFSFSGLLSVSRATPSPSISQRMSRNSIGPPRWSECAPAYYGRTSTRRRICGW